MVAWGLGRLNHPVPSRWSVAFLTATKAFLLQEAAAGGGGPGGAAAGSGGRIPVSVGGANASGGEAQALANIAWAVTTLQLAPDPSWLQVGKML